MEKERLGNVELELKEIDTLNVENDIEESRQTISGQFTTVICC